MLLLIITINIIGKSFEKFVYRSRRLFLSPLITSSVWRVKVTLFLLQHLKPVDYSFLKEWCLTFIEQIQLGSQLGVEIQQNLRLVSNQLTVSTAVGWVTGIFYCSTNDVLHCCASNWEVQRMEGILLSIVVSPTLLSILCCCLLNIVPFLLFCLFIVLSF